MAKTKCRSFQEKRTNHQLQVAPSVRHVGRVCMLNVQEGPMVTLTPPASKLELI